MSNSADAEGAWIYGDPRSNSRAEQECKACHGSGCDRDGADCMNCEGFGSIPLQGFSRVY
jgi:DnaJ-class molecular chaperone